MSEMRVVPIEFIGQYPLIKPLDQKLHDLAIKYILENFVEPYPRLMDMKHVAVECEFEGEEPIAVHGIAALQFRPDFPVWRTSGDKAKQSFAHLYRYFRDYMVANGWRGGEAMVYLDKDAPAERLCPNLESSLATVGAEPAHRFLVKIR